MRVDSVFAQEPLETTGFRHVNPQGKPPDPWPTGTLTLAADADFPPFSYIAADGKVAGIAIDLAEAACAELRLVCTVSPLPPDRLIAALRAGEADAVITPLRLTDTLAAEFDATRPIYRPAGRFAVRPQTRIKAAAPRALAGRKLGVVGGTAHAAWIVRHFAGVSLETYGSEEQALEALRTGQIEIYFGDALRLVYWIDGTASRGCCVLMPGHFYDGDAFSLPYAFTVAPGNPALRSGFDYALDRAQSSGALAQAFRRYAPLPVW